MKKAISVSHSTKVLLFIHIAQAIKGGVLNLQHSYKYRSMDDYLIPKHAWEADKDTYLQRADLTEIAEGCRRLIKNAIICWNYLYLTQKIAQTEGKELREELIMAIRNGSMFTWGHVNLHGEYDFSDSKLSDSVGLNADEILAVNAVF